MSLRSPTYWLPTIIALISLLAAVQLPGGAVFADERNTNVGSTANNVIKNLPDIGNTHELDRAASREVNDSFVFGSEASKHDDISDQKEHDAEATAPVSNSNSAANTAKPAQLQPFSENIDDPKPIAQVKKAEQIQSNRSADAWKPINKHAISQENTVWRHIINSERLPLNNNRERVQFYINQYQRESRWISKILHRGSPYLAHMVTAIDQRFLPVELALLPAIESGYKPTAKSRGNAAGLWQIVPITAKEIGMTRNIWFDARRDLLSSTTAAIDYLSYLNAEFDGDWELTLAAYNAGPGRVRAAIRKNKKAGLATDYWSLPLPAETVNYVPKFLALVTMLKMPEFGGLDVPKLSMEPAFESIDLGFRFSLSRVAKITDIDLNELRLLNAGLIQGVSAPRGPHYLLIPAGSGEKFQQAFKGISRNSAYSTPNTHNVALGDTISSIALKYGITQRELLTLNELNDTKIRVGQKLAVMDNRDLSESTVEYVVLIGDTLSEIAHKFSVNVGDITLSTGEPLNDDVIHPGDTLKIIVNMPTSG